MTGPKTYPTNAVRTPERDRAIAEQELATFRARVSTRRQPAGTASPRLTPQSLASVPAPRWSLRRLFAALFGPRPCPQAAPQPCPENGPEQLLGVAALAGILAERATLPEPNYREAAAVALALARAGFVIVRSRQ